MRAVAFVLACSALTHEARRGQHISESVQEPKSGSHLLKMLLLAADSSLAARAMRRSRAAPSTRKPTPQMSAVSLPPLSDRVFLVTGATDGIGQFTAELLASSGCTVLVHGRNPEKVERVVATLSRQSPEAKVEGFVADLSSLAEVRRLGQEVAAKYPVIHGLANNAGTFAGDYTFRRKTTSDGNEYSLAVNVLAPFLLTSILLENVRASGAGRVLVTSSMSAGSNHKLSDLQCEQGWSDHTAYELSKLCCAMIAMELHSRYADPPRLTFHTMDPGTVNTKMLRAGWGGGPSVRTATTTFEMLTKDGFQTASGSGGGYCRGESETSRAQLWAQLEELTGAQWL